MSGAMNIPAGLFTGAELAAATGGRWLGGTAVERVTGVCTDTRQDGSGKLFLALTGERFDAHDFLADAVASGCAALCVAESARGKVPADCPVPVLLTKDTLHAYQALGRFHRRRFPELRLAAVTGSVGKTSVKEMLRAIFAEACGGDEEMVLSTSGNTNNQIGVPQNLLRLTAAHRFAVIEMGTNHHGEIEPLSRCAEPSAAIVNSIAPCHLEFLGDLAGVAREKSHIFDALSATGTAVIPAECPAHDVLEAATKKFRCLQFGRDVRAEYRGGALDGSSFTLYFPDGKNFTIHWALTGSHQACNASAAAAAALALGISPELIAAGLTRTKLPGMRMKITEIAGVCYVNDAYNANPGSMRAGFEWLAEFADPARLILLLGEMRELGESSRREHDSIVATARRLFPGAEIITVGKEFAGLDADAHLENSPAAAEVLGRMVRPGMLVFAKGSRGIRLEEALPEPAR